MSASQSFTPRFNIPLKAIIQHGGALFHYRGRAQDRERRHIFVSDEGVPRDFSDTDIVKLSHEFGSDGRPLLRFISSTELATIESGKKINWWSLYERSDKEEKARVDRLLFYIRGWEKAGRPAKTEPNLKQVIDTVLRLHEMKRISPSSLRRALERWDGDIDSLVTRNRLKGNRSPKTDEELWLKHQEFAFAAYFGPQRLDVVAVHAAVKKAFREYNNSLPPGGKLLEPLHLSTTYRMLAAEGQFIADFTRYGARKAMRDFRAVGKAPDEPFANAVWEIDASPQPVIALDDDSLIPIGRATITLVLDRYSRAVMGFDLNWRAESLRSVASALVMAIAPKHELLAKAKLDAEYPMMGVPGMIVADHASHTGLRAKGFKLMCGRIGCEPSNTRVANPSDKGKIERMLRTYFFKVCHVLPGSTFSNIFERNKEKVPEKVAVCTISELEHLLLRFIVEVYHRRLHRGIQTAPNLAFKASVEQFGITPPPDRQRLVAILSLLIDRTVQPYGMEFIGLHYNSDELMEFFQLTDRPRTVTLIVDRDEVTRAWWVDPRDGQEKRLFLPEPDRKKYQGWTLAKYERLRAMRRNNPELMASDAAAQKAYSEFVSGLLNISKSDGLANRRRAIRKWEEMLKHAKRRFNDDIEEAPEAGSDLLGSVLEVRSAGQADKVVFTAPETDEDAPSAPPSLRTTERSKPKHARRSKRADEVPELADPAATISPEQPASEQAAQPAEMPDNEDASDIESLADLARRLRDGTETQGES